MNKIFSISLLFLLISCGGEENPADNPETVDTDTLVEVIDTIPPFEPIASNFETLDLLLPEGFTYRVIFQEKTDMVTRADGEQFPAKGNHDLSVFIPDEEFPETKGILYVSHETKYADDNLGDGGGATVF